MEQIDLKNDLLRGADEIAAYTGFGVRQVYYLVHKGELPVTRLGQKIIARKSEIAGALSAGRNVTAAGA